MKPTFRFSPIFYCVIFSMFMASTMFGCSSGGGGGGALATGGAIGGVTSDNLELDITVISIVIPPDLRPEVMFTVMDDAGNTVPLSELSDARFILARLERTDIGSPFEYLSYSSRIEDPDRVPDSGDEATQADFDPARLSGITQNMDESYTYKFTTALPASFDRSATHQLGGQFRRLSAADGVTYRANLVMAFRPDGNPVTETREIVDTQSCNGCHTRLSEHGDIRREVQLCILCHNSGTTDAQTGNSLRFPELIHKIHRGEDLPSFELDGEPYQIVGFRNSVHDYSTVEFPQDIRDCSVCHGSAPQGSIHEDAPTLAGCASCHDRTWFGPIDETPPSFTNHIGGVQNDSSLCALCHSPLGSGVALVDIAHIIPVESDDAPGLVYDITDVFTSAGTEDVAVQIAFTATDGSGNPELDLSGLDRMAATIAYPVSEYETAIRESIASGSGSTDGTLVNTGGGTYLYTFAAELPTDSTDTFAVALEGRRHFTFRGDSYTQGTSTNDRTLFTLDEDIPIQERRMVVDDNKCAACHKEVRMHSNRRTGTQYCVMCHNPNTTDAARRPVEEFPPETFNFKELIHKLHTGEDLTQEYTVWAGSAHNFNELRFPGDRSQCIICHVDGTMSVPLPDEALSTLITKDSGMTLVSETLPTRAACTSCHDDLSADAHALVNTDLVNSVESCSVCHSDSDIVSVANAHALAP